VQPSAGQQTWPRAERRSTRLRCESSRVRLGETRRDAVELFERGADDLPGLQLLASEATSLALDTTRSFARAMRSLAARPTCCRRFGCTGCTTCCSARDIGRARSVGASFERDG
jgi:hypothetical protein